MLRKNHENRPNRFFSAIISFYFILGGGNRYARNIGNKRDQVCLDIIQTSFTFGPI